MHSVHTRFFSVAATVAAVLVVVEAPPAHAAGASDSTSPKRTHTLFMGTDIFVQRQKEFFPVRDVSGESFVITVDDRPAFVPMRGAEVGMKIQQALKLTSSQAVVAKLEGDRAYTPANDPNRKFMANAASASGASGAVDMAVGRIGGAETALHYAQSNPLAPPDAVPTAQAAVGDAYSSLGSAAFSAGSDMNSAGASAATLQAELARGLYDAINISFEVSAEKPLNNPYVVIVARYREPDAKPGAVRNWIYAKSLDPIAEKPRKVNVKQGGFPPGFELESYQVHLYERGTEVATTVSSKQVALTREEAFEYLMIEHLSRHKGASVPASPALAELPVDFHTRVSGGQIAEPLYVKVAASGVAGDVFRDRACTQPLEDEYLGTVVKSFRFKPALEKGKPVESVAQLRLNQLSI